MVRRPEDLFDGDDEGGRTEDFSDGLRGQDNQDNWIFKPAKSFMMPLLHLLWRQYFLLQKMQALRTWHICLCVCVYIYMHTCLHICKTDGCLCNVVVMKFRIYCFPSWSAHGIIWCQTQSLHKGKMHKPSQKWQYAPSPIDCYKKRLKGGAFSFSLHCEEARHTVCLLKSLPIWTSPVTNSRRHPYVRRALSFVHIKFMEISIE